MNVYFYGGNVNDNDAILHAYVQHLQAAGHPAGTIEQYHGWPKRLLRDTQTSALAITTGQMVDWLAARDWKPNTRRKGVQALKLFFAWLQFSQARDDNPAHALKNVRGAASVPRPIPQDVYADALADASGDDWWKLRLAGETGMRRAELAAVHSEHVTRGVLGWVIWVEGKGRRQRYIPLPDDVARWVVRQDGFVWPSPFGGHMIPSAVGKHYRRILGGKFTTHTLRHRFATLAYAKSHDIEAVRALMGHDSVRTTQIYIQSAEEQLWKVASGAWEDAA